MVGAIVLRILQSNQTGIISQWSFLSTRSKFFFIFLKVICLFQVEFLEAYCTPRDPSSRRSPQRSRRSREPRRSPDSSKWRYDSRRNYDFDTGRKPYDYEGRRFDGDSGRRPEFDAESARRRADYESARRTDFDLSAPGVSRRSPESAPEGSVESPPEPAPSAPLRHERQTRHRAQPLYESGESIIRRYMLYVKADLKKRLPYLTTVTVTHGSEIAIIVVGRYVPTKIHKRFVLS